jgi:hypothetical protein
VVFLGGGALRCFKVVLQVDQGILLNRKARLEFKNCAAIP